VIPEHIFDAWLADVRAREPRALELAYALALTLPPQASAPLSMADIAPDEETLVLLSSDVRDMMQFSAARYDAFRDGAFARVDLGNPSIFAFERTRPNEHLLLVNNLARVSQPVKFREYVGRAGWDILNRVEFICPPRAQLDAYEFLWLMMDES
jgi:hypothetical protein